MNEKNFLNTQRPKNWLSPVDYRNGTLHVRTEVFKKPAGDQQVGWTLCYIANQGDYGCADTTYYKSTGVFDRETKMTDWWQNDKIQWDAGIKQIDMIYAIDDSGSGHVTNYPELEDKTTPTRVRITMVQVSAGSTYDPSIIAPTSGGGVGGASGGGAGGAGGASNGGASMLGGSNSGGSGGVNGGGYGGLLGMVGAAGGTATSSAGSDTSPGVAGSSSSGAPNVPTGSSGMNTSPASNAATDTDGGCTVSNAPRASGLAGALAAVTGLALKRGRRRTRSRPEAARRR